MKTHCSIQRNHGLTLVELVVVIFGIAFLMALFLPILAAIKQKESPFYCINNLKEIDLAYRIWEGDNRGLYPTDVSVTNGGAMEWAATGDMAAVFQMMSNELSTPKILICPEDTTHTLAANFAAGFSAKSISYFAGLDATNDSNPQLLLLGDSNFSVDGIPEKPGLLKTMTNSVVTWLPGRHPFYRPHFWKPALKKFSGNVAMNDGSVQQFSNEDFQNALTHTGLATNRFALP